MFNYCAYTDHLCANEFKSASPIADSDTDLLFFPLFVIIYFLVLLLRNKRHQFDPTKQINMGHCH